MQNLKNTNHNEYKSRAPPGSEMAGSFASCRIPQRIPCSRSAKPNTNGPRGCTPSNINPSHRNQRPSSVQVRRTVGQDNSVIAKARPRSIVAARLDTNKSFNRAQRRMETRSPIPDQETIRQREELEVPQTSPISPTRSSLDGDGEMATDKMSWNDKIQLFERMKDELGHRQKCIMHLYGDIKNEHKMMSALGQNVALPPVKELNIMNVARINPEQLLQLCSIGTDNMNDIRLDTKVSSLNVDIEKLAELPSKLVAASNLTLQKRKEVVDWFDTLKNQERGIPMSKLTKKINEFNAENEMLHSSLQTCKAEFVGEVKQFVDNLRVGINTEAVNMQLRLKGLMYEVSQLSTENADLKKQLQSQEPYNWQHNEAKLQELQTELEEEKVKKEIIKERAARAEGQTKIAQEHAEQLEAALEMARAQNKTLESTVSQLTEQNRKLQMDLETELGKLTSSIKENSSHLQEIANAREKLQEEKELLQSRLDAITASKSETVQKLEDELRAMSEKLGRTEKQLKEANKSSKAMEEKLQGFCNGLLEAEIRVKDLVRQLQDKDEQIGKLKKMTHEIENNMANELESARNEIRRLTEVNHGQNKTIEEIKENFREMNDIEKNLRSQLREKGDYIAQLENKVEELEKESFLSNQKTQDYEQKIKSLKMELEQMRHGLGEFRDVGEILELVNQQRNELLDITRQNGELAEALQQKEQELVHQLDLIAQKDCDIEDKHELIKMLTEKDKEQANIVKLLRNNLEMRSKADHEMNEQLSEKTAEVKSLINNLEARKKQISQLEKIILTLEEQLRKVCWQRKKEQEKIIALEQIVNVRHIDQKPSSAVTAEDLDKLIKILEEELETPQASEGIHSKAEKTYTDHSSKEPTNNAALNCENPLSRQMLLSKFNWFSWYNGVEKSFDQKEIKKDAIPTDIQKLPTRLEAGYNLAVSDNTKDKEHTNLFGHDLPVIERFAGPNAYKRRKMFKFAGHKF